MTWQIEATEMLSSHKMFSGLEMARNAGANRICWTAKAMAELCTARWPKRVTAALKSVSGLPEGLNVAEFAACSRRAAKRGSAPTIFTVWVSLASGSANALRMRITTSGKQGRLTVPPETSAARLPRNCNAAARSSGVEETAFPGTDGGPERPGDVVAAFDI